MKAWAKQESYQPGTNMRAWLVTIIRNEFYSQIRKSGREVQTTVAPTLRASPCA